MQNKRYYFSEELPARPGACNSKACDGGYLNVPDFEVGEWVWAQCQDPVHGPTVEGEPLESRIEKKGR